LAPFAFVGARGGRAVFVSNEVARKLKKWQSRNKVKSLFDLIAIFLINFPAVKPTKANSANPWNVMGHL
jgi:hypothetical protein